MVEQRRIAGNLQQQRRRHLCHGVRAVCGNVAHGDAPLLCRRDVDHIKAGCKRVDEPQIRAGVHRRRADGAAVDKHRFSVADVSDHFIRLRGLIQHEFALPCNWLPGDVPGVDEKSIQHCNLHPYMLHSLFWGIVTYFIPAVARHLPTLPFPVRSAVPAHAAA